MKLLVQVTQDDIDHGTPRSCSKCPIARAVNRAATNDTADVESTAVFLMVPDTARETPDNYRLVCADLPFEASTFIANFDYSFRDTDIKLKPFEFELRFT